MTTRPGTYVGKQCNRTAFLRCIAPTLKGCSKSRIPIPIEIRFYLNSGHLKCKVKKA